MDNMRQFVVSTALTKVNSSELARAFMEKIVKIWIMSGCGS